MTTVFSTSLEDAVSPSLTVFPRRSTRLFAPSRTSGASSALRYSFAVSNQSPVLPFGEDDGEPPSSRPSAVSLHPDHDSRATFAEAGTDEPRLEDVTAPNNGSGDVELAVLNPFTVKFDDERIEDEYFDEFFEHNCMLAGIFGAVGLLAGVLYATRGQVVSGSIAGALSAVMLVTSVVARLRLLVLYRTGSLLPFLTGVSLFWMAMSFNYAVLQDAARDDLEDREMGISSNGMEGGHLYELSVFILVTASLVAVPMLSFLEFASLAASFCVSKFVMYGMSAHFGPSSYPLGPAVLEVLSRLVVFSYFTTQSYMQHQTKRSIFAVVRKMRDRKLIVRVVRNSPTKMVRHFLAVIFGRGIMGTSASEALRVDPESIVWSNVLLGRGSYGDVYKARWRGTDVAVKVLNDPSAARTTLNTEVTILSRLRHPNITLFMGVAIEEKRVMIITEFMERGSLHDLLHEGRTVLPVTLRQHMLVQAARGMSYLHENDPPILHKDMKTSNLLVDTSWTVKISDFGLASADAQEVHAGTLLYAAPEVILGTECTLKSDVFSFAIVMWEILANELPYGDISDDVNALAYQIATAYQRPDVTALRHVPPEMVDIVRKCWSKDPRERFGFDKLTPMLEDMLSRFDGASDLAGLARMADTTQAALPETVALIMTDLADSARYWEEHPSVMRQVCQTVTMVTKEHVGRCKSRGYVVKAEGGSHLLVFEELEAGVQTMLDIYKNLSSRTDWPAEARDVFGTSSPGNLMRVGVHWGSPRTEMDPFSQTRNVFGLAVNMTAQLNEIADTGEMVLSGSSHTRLNKLGWPWPDLWCTAQPTHGLVGEGEAAGTPRRPGAAPVRASTLSPVSALGVLTEGESSHRGGNGGDDTEDDDAFANNVSIVWRLNLSRSKPGRPSTALVQAPHPGRRGTSHFGAWKVQFKDIRLSPARLDVDTNLSGELVKGSCRGQPALIRHVFSKSISDEASLRFFEDATRLRGLSHPSLLRFEYACLDVPNICLVFERAHICFAEVLHRNGGNTKLHRAARIKVLLDVAKGLAYLHSKRLRHSNIKAASVYLAKLDFENPQAKLADPLMEITVAEAALRTTTASLFVAWKAPEVLLSHEVTTKADVYSFGIFFWEVLAGQFPLSREAREMNQTQLGMQITLQGLRPSVDMDVFTDRDKAALAVLWDRLPDVRPTMADVADMIEGWGE